MQERIARSVAERDEAEALLGIEPFDSCVQRRTRWRRITARRAPKRLSRALLIHIGSGIGVVVIKTAPPLPVPSLFPHRLRLPYLDARDCRLYPVRMRFTQQLPPGLQMPGSVEALVRPFSRPFESGAPPRLPRCPNPNQSRPHLASPNSILSSKRGFPPGLRPVSLLEKIRRFSIPPHRQPAPRNHQPVAALSSQQDNPDSGFAVRPQPARGRTKIDGRVFRSLRTQDI